MRRGLALTLAILAMAMPVAAGAAGPSAKCAESAERAQSLWKRGKLLDAHVALRECLKPSCPRIVRDDCTNWEPQLEAAVPTVVVAAKNDADEDLTDVVITLDGKRLEGTATGLASPVDPGSHVFRFERAGAAPIERTVVVREGEKRRLVEARFVEKKPATVASPPSTSTSSAPAVAPSSSGPPTLTWILGGAGIAALGGFAILGLTGLDSYNALHAQCGTTRTCSGSEIQSNRTQLWIADVLGVVGVVAVTAAVWIWVDAGPTRVGLGPGDVVVRGSF